MARYTTTQDKTYLRRESIYVTTNHGTNGTLEIQVYDGQDWITTDTVTTTGGFELFVSDASLRFIPTNGMAYSVPEGS